MVYLAYSQAAYCAKCAMQLPLIFIRCPGCGSKIRHTSWRKRTSRTIEKDKRVYIE